jgi:CheY-like chemotaxis protein
MVKANPTILLVEDDADTRDLLARVLSAAGYSVRVAANGWEGLLALEHPVDLVLLDIMMGGMDGVVFLRTLRGDTIGRQVPVVVVTALDVADAARRVRGLGVEHILPKGEKLFPVLKETLRRALATPEHLYHVELPEPGGMVRPFLDVYLKMLAWA